MAIVLVTIISSVYGHYLQKRLLEESEPIEIKACKDNRDLYRHYLQPLWITFLSNNHWQYESVMEHFLNRKSAQRGENIYLLYNYAMRDTGALIIALARRFLP